MDLMSSVDPRFMFSGFFVGLLIGQTGMGGGALMTPILVLFFGIHPATAVGTDLLYASATKTAGTLVHGLNHTVDWRIVRRLAAGSVPAMTAAAYLRWREGVADENIPVDSVVELRNGRVIRIHHEPLPDKAWVATQEDVTEQRR